MVAPAAARRHPPHLGRAVRAGPAGRRRARRLAGRPLHRLRLVASARAWCTPTAWRRCCSRIRRAQFGPSRSSLRRRAGGRPLPRVHGPARDARGARPGLRAHDASGGGFGARGRPLRGGLRRLRGGRGVRARDASSRSRGTAARLAGRLRCAARDTVAKGARRCAARGDVAAGARRDVARGAAGAAARADRRGGHLPGQLHLPARGAARGRAGRALRAARRRPAAAPRGVRGPRPLRDRVGLAGALLRARVRPASHAADEGDGGARRRPRSRTTRSPRRSAARRRSAPRT